MMEVRSLVSGDVVMSVAKSEVRSLAGLKRSVAAELGATWFRVKLCDCTGNELGEHDFVSEVMAEPGNVVVFCIVLAGMVPGMEDSKIKALRLAAKCERKGKAFRSVLPAECMANCKKLMQARSHVGSMYRLQIVSCHC